MGVYICGIIIRLDICDLYEKNKSMKHILLAAVVTIITMNAKAQKFEVGVNGGIGYTLSNGDTKPAYGALRSSPSNESAYTYGLDIKYKIVKSIRVGLSYNISNPSFKNSDNDVRYYYGKPLSSYTANVDYCMSHLHMGVFLGVVSCSQHGDTRGVISGSNGDYYTDLGKGSGSTIGLHVGYELPIVKKIYGGAEASLSYDKLSYTYNATNIQLKTSDYFLFPSLTLGLHYKF